MLLSGSSAFIALQSGTSWTGTRSAQLSYSSLHTKRERKAAVSSYIWLWGFLLFLNHCWLTLIPIAKAEWEERRNLSDSSLCINTTLLPVLGVSLCPPPLLSWLVFVCLFLIDLIQTRVILEETSIETISPTDWHIGKLVRHFLELMIDSRGPSPLCLMPSLGPDLH